MSQRYVFPWWLGKETHRERLANETSFDNPPSHFILIHNSINVLRNIMPVIIIVSFNISKEIFRVVRSPVYRLL
jgi:hypothetical protein